MTAPITPDERAAMRETVATLDAAWEADDPTRPLVTEHATLTLLAHVASHVPRLLDALDTAEAEAKRLTPPCDGGCSYLDGPDEECSAHGRPVAEVWGIVTEVQRQRDEARAEVARLREQAAPVRPDRETIARALFQEAYPGSDAWDNLPDDEFGKDDWRRRADAALDLWPGESRATVQAEALRDAADEWHAEHHGTRPAAYKFLWDRADRLEQREK